MTAYNSNLTDIKFSQISNLKRLFLKKCNIGEIDLSDNINIETLNL